MLIQTPRDCAVYWSEFRHCESLWNRFHHYYTYGTSPSCHQWKLDYYNCLEWEKHGTAEAKVQLLGIISIKTWICDLTLSGMSWIWKMTISIASVLQEALQMSERNRLAEQKKFSPVWNLRREPPRDWHMPLNHEKPQDSWTVSMKQRSSVPWIINCPKISLI